MDEKLLRELRNLRMYNLFVTVVLLAVALSAFRTSGKKKFEEIDVERLNIVEKDGKVKMVLTNQARQPEAIINGVKMQGRGQAPGILLYNSEGDECGGFLFAGDKEEAGQILTFDQYKQDQIMSLQYNENTRNNKKQRLYGLVISSRPDTISAEKTYEKRQRIQALPEAQQRQAELAKLDASGIYGANRLFVGKAWNDTYGLYLNDDQGRKRARFFIDTSNVARLEFYDEASQVIATYPK